MVEIMKKVSDLYDAVLLKNTELAAKEEALEVREEALAKAEKALKEQTAELEDKAKKVKRVADIDVAEANIAARSAELSVHEEDLVERQNAFEAEMARKRADIEKRDKNSQDIAEETLATRDRVQVVLKEAETRRKKYKDEVLKELGKR